MTGKVRSRVHKKKMMSKRRVRKSNSNILPTKSKYETWMTIFFYCTNQRQAINKASNVRLTAFLGSFLNINSLQGTDFI